jgi:hypothetical protein
MSNSTLSSRAKELERMLKAKLKCYVVVGWVREGDDDFEYYMAYIDYKAPFRDEDIPKRWYGNLVACQLVAPPGSGGDPDPWIGMPW